MESIWSNRRSPGGSGHWTNSEIRREFAFFPQTKNNPFIGEPGVGKTAIEGLAQRIVRDGVGRTQGQDHLHLEMSSLLAGAKFGEN